MSLYSLPGQNYIYTLQYSWPRRFFHLTRQGWTFSCRWVAGPTVSLQPCIHWKKLEKVVCPLFYQEFLTNHLRFPDGSNSPTNEAEKLPKASLQVLHMSRPPSPNNHGWYSWYRYGMSWCRVVSLWTLPSLILIPLRERAISQPGHQLHHGRGAGGDACRVGGGYAAGDEFEPRIDFGGFFENFGTFERWSFGFLGLFG